MIYFSLTPHIYAAEFGTSIIILDALKDDYMSLIEDSAEYLKIITTHHFSFDDQSKKYSSDLNHDTHILNDWINNFLELGFIHQSTIPNSRPIASNPPIYGGLRDYQWDTKPGWRPFQTQSKLTIFKAFIQLAKIHKSLKKHGIKGALDAIEQYAGDKKIVPHQSDIQNLADAIDAATLIYPKKTFCLAWATTFVILARKRGWDARLCIGIQTHPFYAHAWADVDGSVIHDDPHIAQVLSRILTFPE